MGIDVTNIKIQDIELPADMKRIMAKQAEAERDKRAKIIESEGELAASQNVAQAAQRGPRRRPNSPLFILFCPNLIIISLDFGLVDQR